MAAVARDDVASELRVCGASSNFVEALRSFVAA
jgi:hypothetical protein